MFAFRKTKVAKIVAYINLYWSINSRPDLKYNFKKPPLTQREEKS
ncbi:hypothetical protein CLV31_10154 [Algoriphagus aquaeductus]|uniref:Uncharacterized protein n=1 Tax=Algoriphagus aquaeductus TaxID=475299 RepID=A0A326S6M8_9BACT|nr:hypothetical protein CLV31_10154 [Algoriphagus aquaeductus]